MVLICSLREQASFYFYAGIAQESFDIPVAFYEKC